MWKSLVFIITVVCTDACLRHEDCVPAGSLCFQRQCVVGISLLTPCRTSLNCICNADIRRRLGVGCKFNVCHEIAGTSLCRNHNDCGVNEVCRRQHCVPAYRTPYACSVNGRCRFEERCISGACYRARSC
ncbi:hypothetical protein M514_13807, partial [Trichuris suis]